MRYVVNNHIPLVKESNVLGLFKRKISPSISALAVALIEAYAERARLAFRLLALEPAPSDEEMAVMWAAFNLKTEGQPPDTESAEGQLEYLNKEFLRTCCQDYITEVCKSDIRLDMGSEQIRHLINPVMSRMSQDRLHELFEMIGAFDLNALLLASATMRWLKQDLDPKIDRSARMEALKSVLSRTQLNEFEISILKRWVSSLA